MIEVQQRKKNGEWHWRNVNPRRKIEVIKFIKNNFGTSWFNVSNLQESMNLEERWKARNYINSLLKTGDLKVKKRFKTKIKDSRIFSLSFKGRRKHIKRKPKIIEVKEVKEIEKEVERRFEERIVGEK